MQGEFHLYINADMGCLDTLDPLTACMLVGGFVQWRGWQGQYQGSKGKPTIVLEAVADYQLWIWHASFGFAGSMNDINIWDQSPLLKSWIDGSFANYVDFEFEIDGKVFHQLWLMAD